MYIIESSDKSVSVKRVGLAFICFELKFFSNLTGTDHTNFIRFSTAVHHRICMRQMVREL